MLAKTAPARVPDPAPDDGVVITDGSFRPIGADAGAVKILAEVTGRRNGGACSLPDEVLDALRRNGNRQAAHRTVHLRTATAETYLCRAYVVEPARGNRSGYVVLHLRKQSSLFPKDAISTIAEEYDLTDREKEALLGIALGLSSKEMAERMNISPNTVRAFVRLIMIKMGVSRRGAIITKLLAHNGDRNTPVARV